MTLEDEKEWSHLSGIVAASDRDAGIVDSRSVLAFRSGKDDEARALRAARDEILDAAKWARTKLDAFIARSLEEAKGSRAKAR